MKKPPKKRMPIPLHDRGLVFGPLHNGKWEQRIINPRQFGALVGSDGKFVPLPVLDKMQKQYITETNKWLRVKYDKLTQRNKMGKGGTKAKGGRTRQAVLALSVQGRIAKSIAAELRLSVRRVQEILRESKNTRKP